EEGGVAGLLGEYMQGDGEGGPLVEQEHGTKLAEARCESPEIDREEYANGDHDQRDDHEWAAGRIAGHDLEDEQNKEESNEQSEGGGEHIGHDGPDEQVGGGGVDPRIDGGLDLVFKQFHRGSVPPR